MVYPITCNVMLKKLYLKLKRNNYNQFHTDPLFILVLFKTGPKKETVRKIYVSFLVSHPTILLL